MTDHESHAIADELVGHRTALLGVAGVVADFQVDLLAKDAACGVDVEHRLLGAILQLRAKSRVRAGHWAADAHDDLRLRDAGQQNRGQNARQKSVSHKSLPICAAALEPILPSVWRIVDACYYLANSLRAELAMVAAAASAWKPPP